MKTISVHLENEYGDSRTIECQLHRPDEYPKTGSAIIAEATQIANDHNPPQGWPYGVPCGTWKWTGGLTVNEDAA